MTTTCGYLNFTAAKGQTKKTDFFFGGVVMKVTVVSFSELGNYWCNFPVDIIYISRFTVSWEREIHSSFSKQVFDIFLLS